MVLPHSPRQGREVEVCLTFAGDSRDVKTDVVFVDDGDLGFADSVAGHAGDPGESVETPEGEYNVHPQVVAPLTFEAEVDVQVAAEDGEEGE